MRERWARWIAALTGVLVLLITAAAARLQNPATASLDVRPLAPPGTSVPTDSRIEEGKQLFDSLGCMRCHAVAGVGSPRSPLDDVAARRDAQSLRDWIVADARVRDQLSARALASKDDYAKLPAEQIEALVAYLQSLKAAQSTPEQP